MPATKGKHTDQLWQKVDAIVNLILENDRYLRLERKSELSKIVKDKFDVSIRTAQRYIAEARKDIRRIGREKKDKAFQKAIRDRELLFAKAKGVKDDKGNYIIMPDFKLALEIVKDRDKIQGLYFETIEHKGTIELKNVDLKKLTDEQLTTLEQIIKRKEDPKPFLLSIGINVYSN